jgi:hypothetical protein
MGWGEAAQITQVIAVPVTALGIIVSLAIGIGTLRELKAERVHRVRPILRFPNGGQVVPVTLSDSSFLPGFEARSALSFTTNRPKGNNRLDATAMWGISPTMELVLLLMQGLHFSTIVSLSVTNVL